MELSQSWGWEHGWVLVLTLGPGSQRLSLTGVPCWDCERTYAAGSPAVRKWMYCDGPSAEDAEHCPEGKDPVHLLAEGRMNVIRSVTCYHNDERKTNSEFIYSFPF